MITHLILQGSMAFLINLVLARTFGPKWLRKMCILVRIEIPRSVNRRYATKNA
jgi:hypothetical protein